MEWMKHQSGQFWEQGGVCAFAKERQTSASHTEAKDVSVEVVRKRQESLGNGGGRRSTDCGGWEVEGMGDPSTADGE